MVKLDRKYVIDGKRSTGAESESSPGHRPSRPALSQARIALRSMAHAKNPRNIQTAPLLTAGTCNTRIHPHRDPCTIHRFAPVCR